MTNIKHISFIYFLFFTFLTIAQIPMGYYDNAEGLDGDDLKAALNGIISNHIEFPYTQNNSTDVWDILMDTDRDPNNPDNVILIYSGWSVDATQKYNNGTGWEREHVWAKSRGNFGTTKGAGTDVHALRPIKREINATRSNRWFGESPTPYYVDGEFIANYDNTNWLWEPKDEVKGDVARMIFYMAVRYEGHNGEPDLEVVDYIPSDIYTYDPVHALLTDLLRWHLEDPVDDWERNRNDIIYYSYQHNRNPFIDHPEFAELIWGEASGITQEKLSSQKELVRVVDILGRETEIQPNILLIYQYTDGTSEKKIILK